MSSDLQFSAFEQDVAVSRNADVISAHEQAMLQSSRILVAGCGSVGGSIVEPLVRLGLGGLVMADPDVYDLSNINRQACYQRDIGRPKADVLADRSRYINPHVEIRTLNEGLTLENLSEALDGVSAVFDGIDVGASPWIKYRLHELACERRIPVLAGLDLGGKALVYTFDYRMRKSKPFYGRATAEAHREGCFTDCLRWVGYSHYPADFLSIVQDRLVSKKPWPQVSYCVQAMGALGTRAVVDVLMHRRVRHIMSLDVNMESRYGLDRLKAYLRFPTELVKAYATSKRVHGGPRVVPEQSVISPLHDPVLQQVLEAMILAPSPHNCQPWKFIVVGPREVRLTWDRSRGLPAVDPDAFAVSYSLGCAIEAAAAVADVRFEPSGMDDPFAEGYFAGTLSVIGLSNRDYARGKGLLYRRATSRQAYAAVPHSKELSDRLERLVGACGATVRLCNLDNRKLHTLAKSEALKLFRKASYVDELFDHFRLSRKEELRLPTGFTRDGLQLNPATVFALMALRANKVLRKVAFKLGMDRAMAASTTTSLSAPCSFLVVAAIDWTVQGRINAGRAIMRVWLELARNNLASQPVDFPISSESGRAEVARMCGLQAGARPVMLMRVGRATSRNDRRSLRLPLATFCELEPAQVSPADIVEAVALKEGS